MQKIAENWISRSEEVDGVRRKKYCRRNRDQSHQIDDYRDCNSAYDDGERNGVEIPGQASALPKQDSDDPDASHRYEHDHNYYGCDDRQDHRGSESHHNFHSQVACVSALF